MTQAVTVALLLVVFPFLMAYAAASDLLTMTIPNRISLALVAGFAVLAATGSLSGAEALAHLGVGAGVLVLAFAMFAFGWIGGGDAKLAAATALWLGVEGLGDYLFLAAIAGGALTLGLLLARQHELPLFAYRWAWATRLHDKRTGVPYGIALAAAALVAMPGSGVWTAALGG